MDFNFSFFDLFEYWDVLKQYINPLSTVKWAIIGGIIGFVILVVAEIILRKKILVRRRHWSLKILAYLYMVFLPLYAGFCFTQWFAYNNVENQLVNNIPTYLGDTNELYEKHLKESLESSIYAHYLKYTGNELIDEGYGYLTSIVKEKMDIEDAIEEKERSTITKIKDEAVLFLVSSYLKDKMTDKLTTTVDEKVMLKEGITKELLSIQIREILDTGVIETIMETHIRNIFGGLKSKAILMFVLGLAIPLIEIIIANILDKKAKRKALATEGINVIDDRIIQ
ncbi:hypothetical protein [Dysgonomonas sp. 25]|uniref:hypothetical protein n=1 Tax=Dysgonomonas sp. 25 TaxID=2302933 RepID=UPI0013D5A271|nr:hypothetical protein [Dysgonomonas sp. 25]NDV68727.1 hypothetical protein [Dysgonomonas sp. 25]